MGRRRVAIVGPVFPFRGGIAYCTTQLARVLGEEDDVELISFRRQYPQRFYPGDGDRDPALEAQRPAARFRLDILNPWSWLAEGMHLRRQRPDAVVFVWWVWVWALPYLVMLALLRSETAVVIQCHNVADKEPSWWKEWLTNRVMRRGGALLVHAQSDASEARARVRGKVPVVAGFLPVHELGGAAPSRADARRALGLDGDVALFFGHIRPFKGLDIALRAVASASHRIVLAIAGEVWWDAEREYRALIDELGIGAQVRCELRYIGDEEVALWFSACDVVLAPYRTEAQSGVAMTAFHFGRPVIATRVGGIPEIIDDGRNGLLVPPEDPAALAAAIDRFFGECDRSAMEEAARRSAAEYSWSEYRSVVRDAIRVASVDQS